MLGYSKTEVTAMQKHEYQKYLKDNTPKTPWLRNLFFAYAAGGAICALGQGIYKLYESWGLSKADCSAAVAMTLIFLGALFTALRLYDKLAVYAGAGTLVPITGFANAVVSPAMEFKSEGYVTGTGAKLFTVVGPVLVFGLLAATVYGVILSIF
jgi:stage V sporulation protein AC